MRTERQKVRDYFRKRGFAMSPVLFRNDLIPHYRRTPLGDHTLIYSVCCCMYGGSNVPAGGIGCVTFFYAGPYREKRKQFTYQAEMLKQAGVYKTAAKTIVAFESWMQNAKKEINSWKVII